MNNIDFTKYNILLTRSFIKRMGKVTKIVGLTVESIGPEANLNDLCVIVSQDKKVQVEAEVIGFRDDRLLLMPYEDITGKIGRASCRERV